MIPPLQSAPKDGAPGARIGRASAEELKERSSPSLGPWKATIDTWLAADEAVPKKQRHTARRIFERLVDEHDADISESTVRRYIGSRKKQRSLSLPDVCVPQAHPLGDEAEVDFGQVHFSLDGALVPAWMFVMRLSASGKGFHRVYFNQAQEVFRDGHVLPSPTSVGCLDASAMTTSSRRWCGS